MLYCADNSTTYNWINTTTFPADSDYPDKKDIIGIVRNKITLRIENVSENVL